MSQDFFPDEAARQGAFPVSRERIFLAHAGVTALPRVVAAAMQNQIEAGCSHHQEFGEVLREVGRTRKVAAEWIGAEPGEIALLGPTSLGLSLFANGITWQPGDEVLIYAEDYPANVYPWLNLQRQGVVVRQLTSPTLGHLPVELIARALSPKTRLVALASAHFLTGWRIDIPAIAELLQSRGVLFSLDAIQTLGAFPTPAAGVDFLSADAHKWMLGPLAIGIVFVAQRNFELCRPTLLGAWNVESPDFIAQPEIRFVPTAQRYEPGVLNVPGILGMKAALELLRHHDPKLVTQRILALRDYLQSALAERGWEFVSPPVDEPLRGGMVTGCPRQKPPEKIFAALERAGVVASLRSSRDGRRWLRFSPHFYNTFAELDHVLQEISRAEQSVA